MKTLIILHGWQSSKEKWQDVKSELEREGIKVVVPDIPGFKPETELKRSWTLDDYLEWLKNFFLEKESVYPEFTGGFFLLGHSFGGRLGIKFAERYPQKLKGLILVSAAGIKRKPSWLSKILLKGGNIVKILKIEKIPFLNKLWQLFRKFFYHYILRKTDYLQATGFLKETMRNILDENLTPLLDKISVSTLIIWGEKDRITPLKDAYLMKEKIENSQLKILKNISHVPHLENPQILAQKIKEFINSF